MADCIDASLSPDHLVRDPFLRFEMKDSRLDLPIFKALHFRSTEQDVTAAIRSVGRSWDYAKDRGFATFVLRDCLTIEQIEAIIMTLNADAHAMGANCCQKTWTIKSFLQHFQKRPSSWGKDFKSAELVAPARRTCCGCHEVGSFALSSTWHDKVARIERKVIIR